MTSSAVSLCVAPCRLLEVARRAAGRKCARIRERATDKVLLVLSAADRLPLLPNTDRRLRVLASRLLFRLNSNNSNCNSSVITLERVVAVAVLIRGF